MYCYRRKAQYHETDQMGVIHHANYVKWMEEARVAYLDALGFGYVDIERAGLSDYGKAGNYFERQIGRWSKQYHASGTESVDAMNRLIPPHTLANCVSTT